MTTKTKTELRADIAKVAHAVEQFSNDQLMREIIRRTAAWLYADSRKDPANCGGPYKFATAVEVAVESIMDSIGDDLPYSASGLCDAGRVALVQFPDER